MDERRALGKPGFCAICVHSSSTGHAREHASQTHVGGGQSHFSVELWYGRRVCEREKRDEID